jgi:selenocysteine-specific elongation factor
VGLVVGTAGHIDHGKSALVKALTGRDPDRLEEEKRRGITIELGYVFMPMPDGSTLSFIDVPGHEKFVRTMVAGVATVDMFLLVVSADEGVMPQTTEHLDILRLLEVNRGIIALSKVDLVDEELQDLAEEEVREALKGTPAEGAPIVRVSPLTGQGIEDIRQLLIDTAGSITGRDAGKTFRMPVDRIFTLKGFGTIVCGTGLSGTVNVGDTLERAPGGGRYRVRELGVNDHRSVKSGQAGDRIALNLVGLHREDVDRGYCFGTPGTLVSLSSVDTYCTMLDAQVDLRPRQRVRFHVGTAEVMARAIPVDGKTLARGSSGYVHFQLEHEVVAMPGDRFVIRRYSPIITIGGGTIIETGTRKVRSKYREDRLQRLELLSSGNVHGILEDMVESRPVQGVPVAEALKETGATEEELDAVLEIMSEENVVRLMKDGSTTRIVSGAQAADLTETLLEAIGSYHSRHPLSYGIQIARMGRMLPGGTPPWYVRSMVSALEESGQVVRRGEDRMALASHPEGIPEGMRDRVDVLVGRVREMGFQTLPASGTGDQDLAGSLVERGLLVELEKDLLTTPDLVDDATALVERTFGHEGFRLGEFREAMGVSRKIALLWAELLDRMGRTRRKDELRFLTEPGD